MDTLGACQRQEQNSPLELPPLSLSRPPQEARARAAIREKKLSFDSCSTPRHRWLWPCPSSKNVERPLAESSASNNPRHGRKAKGWSTAKGPASIEMRSGELCRGALQTEKAELKGMVS